MPMTAIQTLKGFRDFLPSEAKKRNWLKTKLIDAAVRWGYEPIETPTLEPLELFQGQVGEDEKLFYSFEDNGGRRVALRYDQTVPTCRYLGEHYSSITFPFRRYQLQPVFRAEKPQKGRYREFTQFDLDIFGVSSPLADAEVIAASLDIYKNLGFKQAVALINSRDLFQGIPYRAIVAIDKFDKVGGADGVIKDMENAGIPKQDAEEYLRRIVNAKADENCSIIMEYLKKSGFNDDWYRFEPKLARSFSYSQGPIWEIVIPQSDIGSVGGGERYDALAGRISGYPIPATGIGIGFDRTLEAAQTAGLIPETLQSTDVLVTVFDASLFYTSVEVAKKIRDEGINTQLYPQPGIKLEKQLKYADKNNIPYVIIIGPDELAASVIQLKNMKTHQSDTLSVDQVKQKILL